MDPPVKTNGPAGSGSNPHRHPDQHNDTEPPKNHRRHKHRKKKKSEVTQKDAGTESDSTDLPRNPPQLPRQRRTPRPTGGVSSGLASGETPDEGKKKRNRKKKPRVKMEENVEVRGEAGDAEKPKTPALKPKPQGNISRSGGPILQYLSVVVKKKQLKKCSYKLISSLLLTTESVWRPLV